MFVQQGFPSLEQKQVVLAAFEGAHAQNKGGGWRQDVA